MEANQCSICLDPLDAARTLVTTACKHTFHASCYQKWHDADARMSCPLCRGHVDRVVIDIPEDHEHGSKSRKKCFLIAASFAYIIFAYTAGIVIGYSLAN